MLQQYQSEQVTRVRAPHRLKRRALFHEVLWRHTQLPQQQCSVIRGLVSLKTCIVVRARLVRCTPCRGDDQRRVMCGLCAPRSFCPRRGSTMKRPNVLVIPKVSTLRMIQLRRLE